MSEIDFIQKNLPLIILLVIIAVIAIVTGNEGPRNFKYSGSVKEEHVLYGNVLTGYSIERPGITAKIEEKIHDIMRPGEPMRLYVLELETVEFDQKSWWKDRHYTNRENKIYYFQSEGDIADVGMKFCTPCPGRPSLVFGARGVRLKGRVEHLVVKATKEYSFTSSKAVDGK